VEEAPRADVIWSSLRDLNVEVSIAVGQRETQETMDSYRPGLVVLDFSTVDSKGLEFLRHLKRDSASHGTLLLVVASFDELKDIEQVVHAGADEFIGRPVHNLELRKRVENLLRHQHP
jgi:DNA-binding response OmpR family regulator